MKLKTLVAVPIIIIVGVFSYKFIVPPIFSACCGPSEQSQKVYENAEFGFKFQYPEIYGYALLSGARKIIFDPDADSMKTYSNMASFLGQIGEYDSKIVFSNIQKPERFSSTTPVITEIYVIDLTNPNPKNIVYNPLSEKYLSPAEEKKLLQTTPDGFLIQSDTGYYLKKYTTKSGLIVVENDGLGSLGTSFEKMFKIYGEKTALEISVTYVPYYNSPEDKEMQRYIKHLSSKGNSYWRAHHSYLENGVTSKKFRDSVSEARTIIDSLTFLK